MSEEKELAAIRARDAECEAPWGDAWEDRRTLLRMLDEARSAALLPDRVMLYKALCTAQQERDALAAELARCKTELRIACDRVIALQSAQARVAALEAALVYSAYKQHATPLYQLPDGVRLVDGNEVQVLVGGEWVSAKRSAPETEVYVDRHHGGTTIEEREAAADASYRKTRECAHDWVEIDAYPYCEARCRKCGAGKTLPSTSEPAPETQADATPWQPIETAPRDGTSILACDVLMGDSCAVVFWFDDDKWPTGWQWATADGTGYHVDKFTHWIPVPEQPPCSIPEPQRDDRG